MHVSLADPDIDNFDRIISINARGDLLCVRAEVAAMRKQTPKTWTTRNGTRDIGRGVVINFVSANSFADLPSQGSYTTPSMRPWVSRKWLVSRVRIPELRYPV